MDDVIVELKKERHSLRDRLAKIDAVIDEYERWAQAAAELVGRGKLPPLDGPRVDAGAEQTPVAVFEHEVRALLDHAPAPLRRANVYNALTRAGVVVGGKDPLNTVAARLSRMDGVINLKGHGYWAVDRPYPPAGYHAVSASERLPLDEHGAARAERGSPFEGDTVPTNEA